MVQDVAALEILPVAGLDEVEILGKAFGVVTHVQARPRTDRCRCRHGRQAIGERTVAVIP